MRTILASLIPLFLFSTAANASPVEYSNLRLKDGVTVQTCARFPDPIQFPGRRPAIMINMGSGLYDYCRDRTIKSDYVDSILSKGVAVFIGLKRGIHHNPADNTFTSNIALYSQATLPQLRLDSLQVFESFQKDHRVDPKRMALWGGSEGTILSVFIASRHPEVLEVHLMSSMIEDFPTLWARQMYEILPKELISTLDTDHDGRISETEIEPEFLKAIAFDRFQIIDSNKDSALSEAEISTEVRTVLARALKTGDNTFLLSDMGGKTTANWVKSALNEKPLGPNVLKLAMPVFLYHGTADVNTLVGPVYELEREALASEKQNIHFKYYQGLTHELTREVLTDILIHVAEDIAL